MAKGKNKNKNKNVDVVEEVANEKKNQDQTQTPQTDAVKQNQNTENKVEQTKTEQPKEGETQQGNTQGEVKANQNTQNLTPSEQPPTVGESQPEEAKIVTEPETKNEQTKNQQTNKQQTKNEQIKNEQTKNEQTKAEQKVGEQPASEAPQTTQTTQQQIKTQTKKQVQQQLKAAEEEKQPQVLEQPEVKIIQVPIDETKVETPQQKAQQVKANQMSEDLRDGLQLIGKIANQIIFDPLAHEKIAHGEPQFSQNPFQHIEADASPTLQQNTSNKNLLESLKLLSAANPDQIQIKNSTESVQPQLLEKQKQNQKINVLKSYHSSDEESKAKQQKQESQKTKMAVQRKNSEQRRKSGIPVIPVSQSQNFLQLNEQQKKQVDYNKLNSEMLAEREKQWQKIQQKATLPSVKSFQMTHPSPIIETGPIVKPYVTENLGYTNNLPIIEKQRDERKASGEIDQRELAAAQQKNHYAQQKKALLQKQKEKKEKLQQNEKLKKNVDNDQPLKKLGIAALATAACLGICVLGKADKKISAGLSIASFIGTYFVQK